MSLNKLPSKSVWRQMKKDATWSTLPLKSNKQTNKPTNKQTPNAAWYLKVVSNCGFTVRRVLTYFTLPGWQWLVAKETEWIFTKELPLCSSFNLDYFYPEKITLAYTISFVCFVCNATHNVNQPSYSTYSCSLKIDIHVVFILFLIFFYICS